MRIRWSQSDNAGPENDGPNSTGVTLPQPQHHVNSRSAHWAVIASHTIQGVRTRIAKPVMSTRH